VWIKKIQLVFGFALRLARLIVGVRVIVRVRARAKVGIRVWVKDRARVWVRVGRRV
jgi:hypothetical protein